MKNKKAYLGVKTLLYVVYLVAIIAFFIYWTIDPMFKLFAVGGLLFAILVFGKRK